MLVGTNTYTKHMMVVINLERGFIQTYLEVTHGSCFEFLDFFTSRRVGGMYRMGIHACRLGSRELSASSKVPDVSRSDESAYCVSPLPYDLCMIM